ncbi:MAG: GNAT family N-acetyltransferase [Phycisphaerae bacterium]|nr:GNAT family N-acetyltransferase [Phycisphaerae bacterium]
MNIITRNELGHIKIENNTSLLPCLLSYTEKAASMIGFSKSDCNKLCLALEEACVDIITNAFAPNERASLDVTIYQRLDGIELRVHDMGLPYDPNMAPVYDPQGDLEKNTDGLGSFLITQMVDEYQFNNLGNKGKEVVLIKYFDSPCIVEDASKTLEPEIAVPLEKKDVPDIHFNIRLMKDEEALDVCRCIYDCYGYSYANENIYYPERIVAMNQDGRLKSVVAVTDEGEMGGHFALIYYDTLPAEVGIAVTKKAFRGQGFARQLGEALAREAIQDGLKGLQIKEVTAHPYTQKFCAKLGYRDCGLLLAHSPKTLSFKGIADELKQRNSDILGFMYLQTPEPISIYAPEHHREMICKLFSNVGVDVMCLKAEKSEVACTQTSMAVNVHALRSLAEITIHEYGLDLAQAMRQELRKLFMDEIQVIELYLSLEKPMTADIVPELERMGFIFTGVLPETHQGNSMIMQYFNGVYIDYDEIIIVSEVAQALLDYVRKNDPHAD